MCIFRFMKKKLILGNFNVSVRENHMKCFCDNCGLKVLIIKAAGHKNPKNPTSIDLMLTNVPFVNLVPRAIFKK